MPGLTINPGAPVLVTGATGYVAGQLVRSLLDRGCAVHAAVRRPDDTDKLRDLDALAARSTGSIRYFKADLLDAGSYRESMHGCELVFHTASPFITRVDDPVKQLIDPARLGARNVLEEATRTPSVKRVVLTSSCAAIYGDNADLAATPTGVFTEDVWNTSSSVDHQPYSYSKLLAEREAWSIAKTQSRWDLVALNPCMVLGPGIRVYAGSESFNLIKQFGDGTLRMGTPRMGMGVVDVRDVAEAHVRAGFTPSAHGRYIIAGHNSDLAEIAAILRHHYGRRFPLPRWTLPKWLVWLAGPTTSDYLTRKVVGLNIGLPWRADNSRGIRELGLSYRPLATTIVEFFQQLVDAGVFKRA